MQYTLLYLKSGLRQHCTVGKLQPCKRQTPSSPSWKVGKAHSLILSKSLTQTAALHQSGYTTLAHFPSGHPPPFFGTSRKCRGEAQGRREEEAGI